MLTGFPGVWKCREAVLRHFAEAALWVCRRGFGSADAVRQRFRRWAVPGGGNGEGVGVSRGGLS